MADQADEMLGIIFDEGGEFDTIEASADIARGDPLKVTGVADDRILKVAKQTGTTEARFIAVYATKSGKREKALRRGHTGVTFGEAVATPGSSVRFKAGKAFNTASGASGIHGYTVSKPAADGDISIIFFDGVGGV